MLKKYSNYLNLIVLVLLVYLAFLSLKPQNISKNDILKGGFQMENAIRHVQTIAREPHYIGSDAHSSAKGYIIKQLQKLGLQVTIQETNISNRHRVYTRVENILAHIKGSDSNAQSVVLMAHYDSVDFASHGAGDDASGVAVLLEGLRVFLKEDKQAKNDIIVLISDAEEEGLLGAKAFVNKHPWTDNVGAVLNFEARGTSGSSYMIMETNAGNHQLLEAYKNANVSFPSSNSLAYSIYKMLPNDTDLSVFRKDKNISGYNFAFIGDHFNYHTARDNAENLSLDSVAHQALYLLPMLNVLSQIDLQTLQSDQDDVYFPLPFIQTINYPFDWAMTLSIINLLVFLLLVYLGIRNKSMRLKSILSGSFPLLKALTVTVFLCFLVLKFLYWLHPHYSEILQGFTYNGLRYVLFFSLLSLSVCFFFYRKMSQTHNASELMVFPIFLWIFLAFMAARYLTGAHFFIIIPAMGTLALLINILFKKPQTSLTLLLMAPVILIISAFFVQIPVALGLVALPFSCLILVLFTSVFISCIQIPEQITLNRWVFIVPLLLVYVFAETQASFSVKRPLPDSLYYFQDNDSNKAYWMSFDNMTDDWNTPFLQKDQLNTELLAVFQDKQLSWAKIVAATENKNIASATVVSLIDRQYTDKHVYQLKFTPNRRVNILDLLSNQELHVLNLSINNQPIISDGNSLLHKKSRLARIYNTGEAEFILDIEIATDEQLDFSLIEFSPNLLTSPAFDIPTRPKENIPKPFVLSDSIITKQRVKL